MDIVWGFVLLNQVNELLFDLLRTDTAINVAGGVLVGTPQRCIRIGQFHPRTVRSGWITKSRRVRVAGPSEVVFLLELLFDVAFF